MGNRQVVDHFASYAETCFRLYGDRVKNGLPTMSRSFLQKAAIYTISLSEHRRLSKAVQVAYHEILSNAKAVEAYRRLGATANRHHLNLTPSYPRSQHPADVRASEIADAFFNRSFLDPAVKGEFPQL
ncbi:family 1 glycosylhydrolase [Bacillus licheniformis]|nr:family 1 glycosylhydrolase [Bacillus licheniformis]